ncbi:hypothetical protein [Cellulomonas telluris]|uniref:restriction system modified-DNA reader domain-containing protein n=1 Tax=Cellulomonas telluris TaxID=2306636 RepID=UPI0010A751B2|nr:hypothetical protein [Cellulomonas telluris]
MPIFELDEGRPRLVQPMQPLAGSFAQEVGALVTHHLAAIAGEPLFVVRSRAGAADRGDLPELLALDAAGRPVVVEVAQVLDDDAIVAALRRGGAAGRMTTSDLARAYHADPGRFAVDFAAFREHVPVGAQTNRRDGVRLLLLCSEVAAEAADTLAFLRGPARQVEVLQVGVVRGDERRLLDVSPLALHEGSRRSVEPTALRLVRSSEGYTSVAYEDQQRGPGGPVRKAPPTGELRAVTPPVRPEPPAPVPIGRRGSVTEPTPLPFRTAGPTPETPTPRSDEPYDGRGRPDREGGDHATRADAPTLTPVAGLRRAVPAGTSADEDATADTAPTPVVRAAATGTPDRPAPAREGWPYPQLATLAKRRRAVTTLVWVRERRGQRFTALLMPDGMIELPDGTRVASPDEAATLAAGVEAVDGWRAWRLGDGGPTLAEAAGAL